MYSKETVFLWVAGGAMFYLIFMNLIGFYSMWSDKRKAKRGAWRTPEDTLILIAVLGGSIGSMLGMKKFRHKTKHAKFYIGIPVILICQIVLLVFLAVKSGLL